MAGSLSAGKVTVPQERGGKAAERKGSQKTCPEGSTRQEETLVVWGLAGKDRSG